MAEKTAEPLVKRQGQPDPGRGKAEVERAQDVKTIRGVAHPKKQG